MAKHSMGAKTWLIPDCFLPETSSGELESHESTCVLNAGSRAAALNLTAYFEDREPIAGLRAICPARRTNHIRINALKNAAGESVPKAKAFALMVESNVPVVVQHTRLDSTQAALSLMTTMAFPVR